MFIDSKEYSQALEKLLKKVPKADLVLGISRGGLIPATAISYKLNIPLGIINLLTYEITILTKPDKEVKTILLVDDLVDSGNTIKLVKEHLSKEFNFDITTAVLYYKVNSKVLPDIYAEKAPEIWLTFFYDSKKDSYSNVTKKGGI